MLTTRATPAMSTTAANTPPAAVVAAAAGQFDDAPESSDGDDDPLPPVGTKKKKKKDTSCGGNNEQYYDGEDDDEYDDYYDDSYDYDQYDPDDGPLSASSTNAAAVSMASSSSGNSTSSKKMNLSLSHSVANSVAKMQDLEVKKRTLTQGRDDRATSEQVLDPRTRLILFKLLSNGFLQTVNGCLSAGKEANVYYAKAGSNTSTTTTNKQPQSLTPSSSSTAVVDEYAIKIYKTSILVFKDRDKYVSGENRWKRGYCRSNPRKMVKLWAEKEMRNYKRIHQALIPCPCPVLLKSNVLIMEFLGENGWPSPRLKDASLNDRKMRQAYVECIMIVRHLYQRCKLVHGDLSEYNLLWHNNSVYVIDVSQSVESDHPSALDFLRKDVANINDYFRKVGRLDVMTTRQLFDFATAVLEEPKEGSGRTTEDVELESLEKIMHHVTETADRLLEESDDVRRKIKQQEDVDEAVFMSSFLPRSLHLSEYEIQKLEQGEVEDTYAHAVANLTGNTKVVDAVLAKKTGGQKGPVTESVQSILANNTVLPTPSRTAASTTTNTSSETKKRYVPQQDEDQQPGGARTSECSSGEVVTDPGSDDQDEEDEDGPSSDDDNSNEDDDDDDEEEDDEDQRFVKVPRTPEELEAEKLAKRAQRKLNKKAVKEAHSERRQNKMKKRDKKRAIKKSKAGNRKNKK